MNSSTPSQIEHIPPPWTCKGTIYTLPLYTSSKSATSLTSNPDFLFAPLEKNSPFSEGELVGGLSMVQVIRYYDSPVGPYDELLMVPGKFEWKDDGKGERRRNLRITRIYVSQERTCWNGRMNWNIPKHLARFQFVDHADGTTSISVFPYQTDDSGVESAPSTTPFFAATYKNIPYLPSFPISTGIGKYLGLDLSIVQPSLPEGKGMCGELPGAKRWCKMLALEYSSGTSWGWWDLGRKEGDERVPLLGDEGENRGREGGNENWWPGIGRWRVGMKMEDAMMEFEVGEHWLPVESEENLEV